MGRPTVSNISLSGPQSGFIAFALLICLAFETTEIIRGLRKASAMSSVETPTSLDASWSDEASPDMRSLHGNQSSDKENGNLVQEPSPRADASSTPTFLRCPLRRRGVRHSGNAPEDGGRSHRRIGRVRFCGASETRGHPFGNGKMRYSEGP